MEGAFVQWLAIVPGSSWAPRPSVGSFLPGVASFLQPGAETAALAFGSRRPSFEDSAVLGMADVGVACDGSLFGRKCFTIVELRYGVAGIFIVEQLRCEEGDDTQNEEFHNQLLVRKGGPFFWVSVMAGWWTNTPAIEDSVRRWSR